MQIYREFSGDLHTSVFGPTYWNYLTIYTAVSDDARVVFDGCNDSIPEPWTGSANNPTYLRGKFAIYIDPSECLQTTVTFMPNYTTVIHYKTNGQENGIYIYIEYNYFDIPVEYQGQPIAISNLANYMGPYSGKVEFAPCYLPGTMIETPDGERAVESLRAGDEIIVYSADERSTRTITSIGCGQSNVCASAFDDLSGWPVRILKGALSEGVPYKDLLVTSEHCLYLNGCFVPVRMLVNGLTIFYDKTVSCFNYYHISMEPHAIVRANGALSESLIGMGHSALLHDQAGSGSPVLMGDWNSAAAPLNTERRFVEPLYRELEARASLITGERSLPLAPVCDDPGLYLVTDGGKCIEGLRGTNGVVHFAVPHAVRAVHIMSRASRPCDVYGPFVDDRRLLGVLVGAIMMEKGGVCSPVRTHIEQSDLAGWQPRVARDMRWTTGGALLPLPEREHEGLARLSIEIRQAGPYRMPEAICMDLKQSA
ncbi:hypothetical protein AA0311_0893 [Asaia bogorensis NBRC 16594]|uniref:Hedgehog/Intein (Hint) domain-containing protein n=2 Tax=Asaia bogorensis TaxID=91915 RepID=A0AAN4U232_9PROT|nr:outer membrane protein/adhesin family protein [Asaia bogorensis NBRC 16594]GBQ75554.1 hypothetical protein AA0311_0893 [Asaia bogorensis NBRC 16594]GEL53037.1 hypothetical protein ABO01nite_10440 [Asaia bogorensis NBRC 16594]